MREGYNGKILRVNLSNKKIWFESPPELFYRRYMGGSCIGAYYLLKELKSGVEALQPENLLIFAPSVVTGASVPGFSRYAVVAKSPMTGGIGESLTEGYWGAELKFSGFDGIVIEGRASKPVYLSLINGKAKMRDASHFWGKDIKETKDAICKELRDSEVKVAAIGPAGENLVRFASIVSDCVFMNARTGMGAVMGSKNLKAVAVRGTQPIKVNDEESLHRLSRYFEENFLSNPINKAVYELGTGGFLNFLNDQGLVSSRNMRTTYFKEASKISGESIHKEFFDKRVPCYKCPAACRRSLKGIEEFGVDPAYGGPELEVLMAFGCDCCIGDKQVLIKASELCNRYGLDYTSTGTVIAFAMECYENGIISREDTGGFELKFGKSEIIPEIVKMIAHKEGIGKLLAEGTRRAAQKLGGEAESFAMESKGLEVPLHDPRTKVMLGMGYTVSPIGPDDLAVEHDTDFDSSAPDIFLKRVKTLGILERKEATDLGYEKVRMLCYLQQVFSFMDVLCLCKFAFAPCRFYSFSEMVELIRAITGWEISLWELMKLGERRLNMMRVFNVREGLSPEEDRLPERVFNPIESGPKKGLSLSKADFNRSVEAYYKLRNWNLQTGLPAKEKMFELDLGWIVKSLDVYGNKNTKEA
ncbi:MAG: aldehyde ferredoxin oxidoreductase family protein [Candidatus Aerophobetes bacterium]|nr:aldehyde ferredoxin oxidoreductase family protein [Candidatus Aerophobetes bacterium]